MDIFSAVLIIAGLSLFEIVSSIDNAIINAEVLSTMQPRARRWFLIWGMLFAVFLVRGLLPWLILWLTVPGLSPWEAFTAAFSSDPMVKASIEKSSPMLLMGGGTFLVFLFLHWLFIEHKNFGLFIEPFFQKRGVWFFAVVSVFLTVLVWYAMKVGNMVAFAAVVGSTAFFITHGFKQNAEESERDLLQKKMSDISKILYLEVIDMTFSIDGVLGAFAFTLSIPIILLGNGIGALVVREVTVSNIERIKKYSYLKNGAMYSILGLGTVMIVDAFGVHIPPWVTPLVTFSMVGFFFWKSVLENRSQNPAGEV